MPNVLIREVDSTQASAYTGENNVVVIPGMFGTGAAEQVAAGEFVLVSTTAEFEKKFGTKPSTVTDANNEEDKSWIMAWELLNLGMQVLYCVPKKDGAAVTKKADMQEVLGTEEFWKSLTDRGLYDFRFLTSGGYCANALTTPEQKITKGGKEYLRSSEDDTVAESEGAQLTFYAWKYTPEQGDAEYLYTLTTKLSESVYTYTITEEQVENDTKLTVTKGTVLQEGEFENTDNATASTIANQMLNVANVIISGAAPDETQKGRGDIVVIIDRQSGIAAAKEVSDDYQVIGKLSGAEYGAAFTPWVKINLLCPREVGKSGSLLLPPSYGYLAAYADAIQYASVFNAMAGSVRGEIPNLAGVEVKYGEADNNILTKRADKFVSVNPIRYVRPFGTIVFGNRTLKPNPKGLVATSFLSVRNMVCSIKKVLYEAAREFTFEQNTNLLWTNFKAAVTPLLDRFATSNGLESYSLRREEVAEKAKLKAIINIKPIEPVEDFDLTVNITDEVEVVEE